MLSHGDNGFTDSTKYRERLHKLVWQGLKPEEVFTPKEREEMAKARTDKTREAVGKAPPMDARAELAAMRARIRERQVANSTQVDE